MTPNQKRHEWRAIGASVQGAAHMRTGKPNQDALDWLPGPSAAQPLVLAGSDGHGGEKYFRSQHGARLAVQTALAELSLFCQEIQPAASLAEVEQRVNNGLPRRLVERWAAAVQADLVQAPFTPAELAELVRKEGAPAAEAVQREPLLAYGATLLAVAVTDQFVLLLQLGDGDILFVDGWGETGRPLQGDSRLIANETTSLCMPRAWRDFRLRLLPADAAPVMILAATDGYANSFRTEQGFLQVGRDYLQIARDEGMNMLQEQLPAFLRDASRLGSGDDISLGILKRRELRDADTILELHARLEQVDERACQAISQAVSQAEQQRQPGNHARAHTQIKASLMAEIAALRGALQEALQQRPAETPADLPGLAALQAQQGELQNRLEQVEAAGAEQRAGLQSLQANLSEWQDLRAELQSLQAGLSDWQSLRAELQADHQALHSEVASYMTAADDRLHRLGVALQTLQDPGEAGPPEALRQLVQRADLLEARLAGQPGQEQRLDDLARLAEDLQQRLQAQAYALDTLIARQLQQEQEARQLQRTVMAAVAVAALGVALATLVWMMVMGAFKWQ